MGANHKPLHKITHAHCSCSVCTLKLAPFIYSLLCLFRMCPKSTENCVCILHNLSYQIEAELPKSYARDFGEPLQKSSAPEPKVVGCFAHRSAKITEVILSDNDPH